MKRVLFALTVSLPTTVQAGIPDQVELICPVGGERFEITETLSCTTYSDRTMSFAPTSSCDFVTRLPQCPQNHLPMYKEFTEADIAFLREYMLSETYDSMVDRSRYYMAYTIERQLGSEDPSDPFWLLLQGLWFDPDTTFSDEGYLSEFLVVARSEIERETEENRPYLQSLVAFAQVKAGNLAAAQALITAASTQDIPFLRSYHRAIEACMDDPNSAFCDPGSLIPAAP